MHRRGFTPFNSLLQIGITPFKHLAAKKIVDRLLFEIFQELLRRFTQIFTL